MQFLKDIQQLRLRIFLVVFWCFIWSESICGQSVGVVLSGGGATALAHVGFLRVLEEKDIPIDYIGGTSMGAVIAAMYASGFSVADIDSVVNSEEFLKMANGQLSDSLRFYFKRNDADASMANLKYNNGKLATNVIPTSLIDPVLLDWNFMVGFSQADAAAGGNFDSLFVPFRCLAADVERKEQVYFRNGPLNVAVRASSTYPFYLPPLRVGGQLLYDGGIYNNFPSDLIYQEFIPDVILGCNVSGENGKPIEDDLFSQLQSMILYRGKYIKECEYMLVVEPPVQQIGTFDFEDIPAAIQFGYRATLDSIKTIEQHITRRVTLEEKQIARKKFRSKFKPLIVEEVVISGLEKSQKNYVNKFLGRKQKIGHLSALKEPYFRIFDDDKIKSIYPIAQYNPKTERFKLLLDVKKEKDLMLSFGGNFSSRSINTGFIGLRYNLFGKSSATFSANSYFGRFYGSINSNLRWDIAGSYPIAIQTGFTFNRWDYYKSLATFFEDVKPSFILLNERFSTLSVFAPAGNKGMIKLDLIYAHMFDSYYQTTQFLSIDTADRTDFDAGIARFSWERNTLNKKQFANAGTFFQLSAKYVYGQETTVPGTTSIIRDTVLTDHQWVVFKMMYTNYFNHTGRFRFGFNIEAIASTQNFFKNYIASVIAAPSFNPIPESRTLFLPQFRAHNYVAGGLMAVYSLSKNIDIRAEGYVFNAFGYIVSDEQKLPVYQYSDKQFFIGSSSLVYHSPLGPLSLAANYYDQKEDPWSVIVNFGYILFNRSARD